MVEGEPAGRRLLCVGAVIPAKGHDVLLEALARVAGPAWTCELVGSLERDPGFVVLLRGRALELGIADRVRFLGALVGTAPYRVRGVTRGLSPRSLRSSVAARSASLRAGYAPTRTR